MGDRKGANISWLVDVVLCRIVNLLLCTYYYYLIYLNSLLLLRHIFK